MVEVVETYNQKLQQSEVPKLLLYATPGALITAPVVEWRRKNLKTVDIGQGVHYIQEDNPRQIGAELGVWYSNL